MTVSYGSDIPALRRHPANIPLQISATDMPDTVWINPPAQDGSPFYTSDEARAAR